ncbi:MAG: hypothetical protein Q8P23_04085 [bacterium]|nr:hypothetical protein [bacterium]
MTINKCDLCKKIIDEEKLGISLLGDRFEHFDLCPKCAKPVMKFLKAKKLIKAASKDKK